MKLKVYTDGACSGNPGPGGYAAVIIDEKNKETIISGGEKQTTNNRMEMTALIEALKYLHNLRSKTENLEIELFIDSQYVLKGTTEWLLGWKRKNWKTNSGQVKNRDLWEEIDKLKQGLKLKWIWVKGHNEDKYNEMADRIAVENIRR